MHLINYVAILEILNIKLHRSIQSQDIKRSLCLSRTQQTKQKGQKKKNKRELINLDTSATSV